MANLWSEQNLFKASFSSCSSVDCCWLRTLHMTAGCQLKLRLQVLALAAGCRLKGWLRWQAQPLAIGCWLKCKLQAQALAAGSCPVAAGVRLWFWLPAAGSCFGCWLQIPALDAGCRRKSGCRPQLWLLAGVLSSVAAACRLPLWLWSDSTQQLSRMLSRILSALQ